MRRVNRIIVLCWMVITVTSATFSTTMSASAQAQPEARGPSSCAPGEEHAMWRMQVGTHDVDTCLPMLESGPLGAAPTAEGSWQLLRVGTPENPVHDPMLATFFADGTLIVSARVVRPANHDMPYDATYFSTGHGTWQQDEAGSVSFTVVHLRSDETGALLGSVTVTGTFLPGMDGQPLTVNATYTLHDPLGRAQSSIPATLSGQRIGIDETQVAIQD